MLVRDVTIIATVVVLVLATSVKTFPPNAFGKANTVAQIATMFVVLCRNAWYGAETMAVVDALIWVTAATTVLSSVQYALDTSRRLQGYHSDTPSQ